MQCLLDSNIALYYNEIRPAFGHIIEQFQGGNNMKKIFAALLAAVMENENVKKRLEGKTIIKTIVVPGKLVNLVVK